MNPKPGESTPASVKKIINEMARPNVIFNQCIARLQYDSKGKDWFREHFTEALIALMKEGEIVLREEQKKARKQIAELAKSLDEEATFEIIEAGGKSFRNQMMKRAGVHMELCSSWILTKCGIPNEDGQEITGRSDRVCPNLQTYKEKPERSVVLEFKRTVRERWKEVRDEISRSGHAVWLVTLDDYIADTLVDQIAIGNITIFLRPEIYSKLIPKAGKLRSMDFLVEDIEHVIGKQQQQPSILP